MRICLQVQLVIIAAPLLTVLSATGSASGDVVAPVVFTNIVSAALPSVVDVRTFGVCVGELAGGDDLADIYVGQHLMPPALLLNNGSLVFALRTREAALALREDFHGCAWGDYDEDGDLDLYQTVGAVGGTRLKSNFLYRNDGSILTDVAKASGVSDPPGRGRSAAWLDYDNDGLLDLFVGNAARADGPDALFRNLGNNAFSNTAVQAGVATTTSTESITLTDFDRDGNVDVFIAGGGLYLYHNRGDGTFADMTEPSGLAAAHIRNSTDAAWGDFDGDGDADLFVVSSDSLGDDVVADSELIAFETRIVTDSSGDRRDGLHFATAGATAMFDLFVHTLPAVPDRVFIGRDGAHPEAVPFTLGAPGGPNLFGPPKDVPKLLDHAILVWRESGDLWSIEMRGHTLGSGLAKRFRGTITSDGPFTLVDPYDFEFPKRTARNYLFENRGDGTFRDVTAAAGLAHAGTGRSVLSADFDNDGDLDLYVVRSGIAQDAPDSFYDNGGDGTFVEIGAAVGLGVSHRGNGESAAYGDFDDDGFLDIITTHGFDLNRGPYALWHNEGNGNNWVRFRLVGTASNSSGIGARVTVGTASGEQVREQNGGFHRYSQNSMFVHFGLGTETAVEWARIEWPSGLLQMIAVPVVNRTIEVIEPVTGTGGLRAATAPPARLYRAPSEDTPLPPDSP